MVEMSGQELPSMLVVDLDFWSLWMLLLVPNKLVVSEGHSLFINCTNFVYKIKDPSTTMTLLRSCMYLETRQFNKQCRTTKMTTLRSELCLAGIAICCPFGRWIGGKPVGNGGTSP